MTMRTLAAIVLSFVSLVNAQAPVRFDDKVSKAYHHVNQSNMLEEDSCTAAAIGQHALLIATHCELGSDEVKVDGIALTISQKIRDGKDHTIYILPLADFNDILQFANRQPVKGERVREWGFPGNVPDKIYSEGTFVSTGAEGEWLFNLRVSPGDSGSAIIDDQGKVLTVVSLGDSKHAVAVGFPLSFTNDQLAKVK